MRIGELLAAAGVPLLLADCALPAQPSKSCKDAVSVHFSPGAAQLNLDAVGQVLLAVSTLDACPAAHATVTGHADRGELEALSAIRAANVASVLAKNGIDRARIQVRNAGLETQPDVHNPPDNRVVAIEWR